MVFSIEILERENGLETHARRRLRTRNHLVHSPHWRKAGVAAAALGDALIASLQKGGTAARHIAEHPSTRICESAGKPPRRKVVAAE